MTGAARGLGAAIAASCVAHGARVVIADVLEAELDETAERLGPAVTGCHLDVPDPSSWQRLGEGSLGGLGRPDALVNNAGIVRPASLLDATYEDLQRTRDVNV